MYITESLFADDTTVLGKACEVDEATQFIKESLALFEKRTNDAKKERARLGKMEAKNIKMLGVYLGREKDIYQRLRKGALIFARIRKHFTSSRLSKRTQALVLDTCVESTMLFNCNTRPFYKSEMKQLQKAMYKRYRLIWGSGNKVPLREMEEKHVNMWNVRRQLGVKSIRTKIKIAHLRCIGHVVRLPDNRLVKRIVLGWNAELEGLTKARRRQQTTLSYWRKLLTDAAIPHENLQKIVTNRKRWNSEVNYRRKWLKMYECQQRHQNQKSENRRLPGRETLHVPVTHLTTEFTCEAEGGCKNCKSKAGVAIQKKIMHKMLQTPIEITCVHFRRIFNQKRLGRTIKKRIREKRSIARGSNVGECALEK